MQSMYGIRSGTVGLLIFHRESSNCSTCYPLNYEGALKQGFDRCGKKAFCFLKKNILHLLYGLID